ncbi:MAG: acylneuraminate cytidylyltransferase family protein, partial [Lachnospiraceae bacterium]|nr:acylneuraminate cytidylyltransferase family protein [Lachnospiraceae bacterium]
KMKKILAIIPARSGSKSVKNKNIRLIGGKPMLAYSIEHAKQSKYINRILVTTDSEEYAAIAREYGAETPFIRPAELAQDDSLDVDVFAHAIDYLAEEEQYEPDIIVQLRPTTPVRDPEDIDRMIEMMLSDDTVDAVRSVTLTDAIPHKMWYVREDDLLEPIMKDIPEAYNMARQNLPKIYLQNGNTDVLRPANVTKYHSMTGKKIKGYVMKEIFDVDTPQDFERASEYLKIKEGGKIFVFDIDGVIAQVRKDLSYGETGPNEEMVRIVNRLYDLGNRIVLFTARGYVTGIDWYETTKKQMEEWGVKYHELHMGKPNADYYVDDKMLSLAFLYDLFGE